jgi:hypothetical protein
MKTKPDGEQYSAEGLIRQSWIDIIMFAAALGEKGLLHRYNES